MQTTETPEIQINTNFDHHILKNLLSDSEYFSKVFTHLSDKLFKTIGSKTIFNSIKSLYFEQSSIPSITELAAGCKNISNVEVKKQVVQELVEINKLQPSKVQFMIPETVKYIKNSLFTEGLMIGADGISKNSEEVKKTAWALMEEAVKFSINSDIGLDYELLDDRIAYYQQKQSGLFTGIKEIDDRLGPGILQKTLSIIAAPQGIGKSLMLADFASSFIKQRKNVLMISMEMSDFETAKRIDANVLNIPIQELRETPRIVLERAFESIKDQIGKFYIREYSPNCFSANMLDSLLQVYKNELSIEFDVIILDYMGLMKSDRMHNADQTYNYMKSISEEVRGIAVKNNIPIISASQLNRSSQQNLEAGNESMSESMGIVMTADFIMMLLQTDEYKKQKKMKCKITKNRFSGITDDFELGVDYRYMRFTSVGSGSGSVAPVADSKTIKKPIKEDNKVSIDDFF